MTESRGHQVSEKVIEAPDPEDTVLVCGLPGSGYVGKLAADHLVSSFTSQQVAEYSSPAIPPQGSGNEDGTVDQPRGELYLLAS